MSVFGRGAGYEDDDPYNYDISASSSKSRKGGKSSTSSHQQGRSLSKPTWKGDKTSSSLSDDSMAKAAAYLKKYDPKSSIAPASPLKGGKASSSSIGGKGGGGDTNKKGSYTKSWQNMSESGESSGYHQMPAATAAGGRGSGLIGGGGGQPSTTDASMSWEEEDDDEFDNDDDDQESVSAEYGKRASLSASKGYDEDAFMTPPPGLPSSNKRQEAPPDPASHHHRLNNASNSHSLPPGHDEEEGHEKGIVKGRAVVPSAGGAGGSTKFLTIADLSSILVEDDEGTTATAIEEEVRQPYGPQPKNIPESKPDGQRKASFATTEGGTSGMNRLRTMESSHIEEEDGLEGSDDSFVKEIGEPSLKAGQRGAGRHEKEESYGEDSDFDSPVQQQQQRKASTVGQEDAAALEQARILSEIGRGGRGDVAVAKDMVHVETATHTTTDRPTSKSKGGGAGDVVIRANRESKPFYSKTAGGVILVHELDSRMTDKEDKQTQCVGNHACVQADLFPSLMHSAVAFSGPRFMVPGVGYHNAIPGPGGRKAGPYSGLSGRFPIEMADLGLRSAPPSAKPAIRKEAWGATEGATPYHHPNSNAQVASPGLQNVFVSYMNILKEQHENILRSRAQLAHIATNCLMQQGATSQTQPRQQPTFKRHKDVGEEEEHEDDYHDSDFEHDEHEEGENEEQHPHRPHLHKREYDQGSDDQESPAAYHSLLLPPAHEYALDASELYRRQLQNVKTQLARLKQGMEERHATGLGYRYTCLEGLQYLRGNAAVTVPQQQD